MIESCNVNLFVILKDRLHQEIHHNGIVKQLKPILQEKRTQFEMSLADKKWITESNINSWREFVNIFGVDSIIAAFTYYLFIASLISPRIAHETLQSKLLISAINSMNIASL